MSGRAVHPGRDGGMSRRNLSVTLRCEECGAVKEIPLWFSLTKNGVLRLEGGSYGYYVDGEHVLCREHTSREFARARAQTESWTDYDRRAVNGLAS